MNTDWQDYLQGDGALLENSTITGFSQPGSDRAGDDSAPGLTALVDLGVIKVSGEDASTFLQAHFCNDVSQVSEERAQLSGYCSPKGRLLAMFILARQADDFLLVLPREVIETVLKRLSMFAQMARPAGKQMFGQVTRTAVALADASDELLVVGFESAGQAGLLDALDVKIIPVLTAPAAAQRYLCVATKEAAIEAWAALKPGSERVGTDAWRLGDIRAGNPTIVQATQDSFVPQMTNLHLLDGVSFTKGCYPGQEIVARMQYLGTLKRRMERFAVAATGVQPGTVICGEGDLAAGVVVQAAVAAGASSSELLAVMKISALDGRVLYLGDENGPPLERLDMPYELEPAEADPK